MVPSEVGAQVSSDELVNFEQNSEGSDNARTVAGTAAGTAARQGTSWSHQ